MLLLVNWDPRFFEYVRDRIAKTRNIPPLATIIYDRSSVNCLGWSWQL
ncbi:MAG: hypothetical protein F6K23_22885 [Okeania sp. SIO2C9]|nr:hypothetical protein [Okeania sp. SIO2C9]NEQ75642.1 hypothetical protein [Okeania sp. SIO2C9]